MVSAVLPKFLFFALTLLHCVLCAASLDCRRSEFECSDGSCIEMYYRCDGGPSCPDRSDKTDCATHRCNEGEYRCGEGRCIPGWRVCDGSNDCTDSSDEKDCLPSPVCLKNQFRCKDHIQCIPMRYRCDGGSDCSNDSDEKDCERRLCPDGDHRCDIGKCVPESLVCDGHVDCADHSDENDCGFEDIETIFFNQRTGVFMKVRTKAGFESTRLLPVQFSKPIITGLSYDVKRRTLYVSEAGRPAIYAVKVQALYKRELVTDRIAYPVDISFDWSGDNVYWLDSVDGTAEVVSVVTLRRSVIIRGLMNPVSLALSPNSGTMFIATTGFESSVSMYGMDGRNRRVLESVRRSPLSLALHPSKTLLYWSDPLEGTISYVNYSSSRPARVLKRGIKGVMSVSVSEREVLYTFDELSAPEGVQRIRLPGYEKGERWKSITFGVTSSGKSECLIENGGCDHLCLTSEVGRSCACPSEKTLGEDGKSCLG